ncbi:MAG: phosphoadenosine phosphosulfate reductase, partial [Lachnospiraceae bacterium]|nr:phosphoadenosine phosphosulfate reductase [Lachnospiraceae bacterium]
MKKHIILWSGGKDSTATIILCHIHQIPIDEIIFTEVMYDKRRNISGELPEHIHFIKKVAKPLFEEWGYKVTILSGETDYLSHFNRIIENPTKHMAHKGKSFGFPLGKMCAVRRDCKIKVAAAYVNQKYGKKGYHLYVGI